LVKILENTLTQNQFKRKRRVVMSKAAVAIDTYKLHIFEKNLKEAGLLYEVCEGITKDTLLLVVQYTDMKLLKCVVMQSMDEPAYPTSTALQ
jgi:hypothetical protein